MADYAIGDVQGCYNSLLQLLSNLSFDREKDRLWFVGDLVNRGPDSLAVLRFIKALPVTPRVTLGNHDLYLLSKLFTLSTRQNVDDTLDDILMAPDRFELGHWLRQQSILYHDERLNVVMCHAGIAPLWSLLEAKTYARELEAALAGEDHVEFLTQMYGNAPDHITPDLPKFLKLRVICNYFTRMRFCDEQGHLVLTYKGTIEQAPPGMYPWFALPWRKRVEADLVFGHWAALQGQCFEPQIHAIDTGCLWGGQLTALRLQDMQRFSVSGRQ